MKLILASCVLFLTVYVASADICTCWLSSINRPTFSLNSSTVLEGVRDPRYQTRCGKPYIRSCVKYCENEVQKRINLLTDEQGIKRLDLTSPPKTNETSSDSLGQILCDANPNLKKFFTSPFPVSAVSVLYCTTKDRHPGIIRPAVRYTLTRFTSATQLVC